MRQAAEGGVLLPSPLFSLTPRELAAHFTARRVQAAQRAYDRWQFSRLIALAVHAPDRLPPPPSPPPGRPMTADEIKQRLLAWRGKDVSS